MEAVEYQLDKFVSTNEEKLSRLKMMMIALNIKSYTALGKKLGYSQGYMSEVSSGKKEVSDLFSYKLQENLGVSRAWFETGEGEMMIIDRGDTLAEELLKPVATPRSEADPLHLASDPHDFNNDGSKFEAVGGGIIRMRVKVVPQRAYAGYLRGYADPEFYEDLQTVSIDVLKEHRGHYLAFEVRGDSMIPVNPSEFEKMALPGWKAVSRELPRHQWGYKLHTHTYDHWIIVHKEDGILLKTITKHDVEKGIITIHSLNPNYEDQEIHLDDCAQIFAVVKYIIDMR